MALRSNFSSASFSSAWPMSVVLFFEPALRPGLPFVNGRPRVRRPEECRGLKTHPYAYSGTRISSECAIMDEFYGFWYRCSIIIPTSIGTIIYSARVHPRKSRVFYASRFGGNVGSHAEITKRSHFSGGPGTKRTLAAQGEARPPNGRTTWLREAQSKLMASRPCPPTSGTHRLDQNQKCTVAP
jgi:hypothetical protein